MTSPRLSPRMSSRASPRVSPLGDAAGGPLASLTNRLALHLQSDFGVTAVGGKVAEWAGQEGWRNTVVQTVDANRPTVVANVLDGQPAIRFGGSQWLEALTQVGVVAGDLPRMYVVGSFADVGTSFAGGLANYTNGGAVNTGLTIVHSLTNIFWATHRNGAMQNNQSPSAAGNNSRPTLFDGRNDLSTLVLAINGVDLTVLASGGVGGLSTTPTRINVGREVAGTFLLTGDLFAVIVVNNSTPQSHATIMTYLAAKYPSIGLGTMKPLGTKLVLDLDADVGVTAVGGKVSQWNDQSSYANHVAQATGANQPTLVPNVFDGHAALRFDGNQWISRVPGFAGLPIGSVVRIYCIMCHDDPHPATGVHILGLTEATQSTRQRIFNNSAHFFDSANAPAATGVAHSASTTGFGGVPALIDCSDDLTTVRMFVNGVLGATATASPGATSRVLDRIAIGSTITFGAPMRGKIVRLIIVNNPTAAEHTYIMSVLKSRYPSLALP